MEYTKTFLKMFRKKEYKTAIVQACAILVSVALCLCIKADLYAYLGIPFGCQALGVILTGIFASRGANYLSDLIKRLQSLDTSAAKETGQA